MKNFSAIVCTILLVGCAIQPPADMPLIPKVDGDKHAYYDAIRFTKQSIIVNKHGTSVIIDPWSYAVRSGAVFVARFQRNGVPAFCGDAIAISFTDKPHVPLCVNIVGDQLHGFPNSLDDVPFTGDYAFEATQVPAEQ